MRSSRPTDRRSPLASARRPGAARTAALHPRRGWRRALRRRRRAILLLAVTALLAPALVALLPPPARTVAVVVAARDIAPGHRLTDADLRIAQVPQRLAPSAAVTDPAALAGARTRSFVPAGSAVTRAHVADAPSALAGGRAMVAVPVADDLMRHLTPGTSVVVLAPAEGDDSATAARRIPATVVQIPADDTGRVRSPLVTDTSGRTVVLAVDPGDLAAIAHATRTNTLLVAVVD